MTRTGTCGRVAFTMLLAASVTVTHETRADIGIATNGISLNGVNMQGTSPNRADARGLGPYAVAPARAANPSRLRLRALRLTTPERAVGSRGGARIAAGTTDKPEPTPTPKK